MSVSVITPVEPVTRRATPGHLITVDALRGIAAFSVLWYHLTGFGFFSPWLRATGIHGNLGVEVFYVISGFIIPYALYRAKYLVQNYGRFLAKRITRLDPPYFATIALFLLYQYVATRTSLHRGIPFQISAKQLLAHFGYVNAFIGLPWYQDSFWTLAIEFQYYIAVGLLFPLLASRRSTASFGICALVGAAACSFPQNAFLLHHLPIFLMGIAIFRFRCLNISKAELIGLMAFAIGLSFFTSTWLQTAAGMASSLTLLFVHYSNRFLKFLGDVSYSLYLTHGLIVLVVANQGYRWFGNRAPAQIAMVLVAISASLAAAYLMFRFVELPAKRWASRINYSAPASAPH